MIKCSNLGGANDIHSLITNHGRRTIHLRLLQVNKIMNWPEVLQKYQISKAKAVMKLANLQMARMSTFYFLLFLFLFVLWCGAGSINKKDVETKTSIGKRT